MAHTWTWDKLARNAHRLNPKSRGSNYPYVPKFEISNFTSGPNRGQKCIVPMVGTKSVLISLRAWGVTQASLHNITMLFSGVDIKTEDPHNRNYFQIQYNGKMYWIQKLSRVRNPLTSRCTCFTGDTEVLLGDGTYKPIRDLVGQEGFDIISYNEELDKFEKVKAYNCSLKGTDKNLIRVTLDDGQNIECTLDHRFLLRNGDWIQAQDLQKGDSLRALYYNTYANNKIKRLLPDGKKQTIVEHKGKEDFYIYVYLDPRYPGSYKYETCEFNFKPIYIGKGRRNRYIQHWLHPNRGDYFHNTLKHLKGIGMEPIILKQSINLTEHVAYKIEAQLTHEIGLLSEGKGPLLNNKHGGEGGLSGISKLKVIDTMTNKNPMKNPEVAAKVRQANIDNGCFERHRKHMQENNPMKNEECRRKATESYLKQYTPEELSTKGKYMASCRTPEVWERIKQSHKTNPQAIEAHHKTGKLLGEWNKKQVELGLHHTQTQEWKNICRKNTDRKIQALHDHTLEQLIQIVKLEGFVNLDSYKYKKGYNYSISSLKAKDRQRYIQQEALEQALMNHKVVHIERIGTGDVYCLTAEYFGNFVVKCGDSDYGIKSGVVVENCKDYFFTWAWYNAKNGHCLYGPLPRPYQRKTTTRPPRNAQGLPGICKHIYHAWALLRNSGLTID